MALNVIIPVYNHAEALGECLSSLYGQTLRPDRIVIVNDGSTDNPEVVARAWQDKLPIAFVYQENHGASAARNRGFQECHAELVSASPNDYIIFCDADITMRPDCLEKMHRALEEHPNASYVYSSFKFGFKTFTCGAFDADRLRKMPYITTTSLIRAKDFSGFDESLKKFQDWDLWLTMLAQNKIGVWVPEVLFSVTPRKSGMSSWLPSFVYTIPWPIFGLMPREVRRYREAKRIIQEKHNLE
ncbi:MAG: glycosyltransferase family 2 protein [Candidatus Magasanikbacteria bacterium]|nr:glycosyltransferase family 2 protein [Candidatus Magasanikbacteria bacterium]